MESNHNSRSPKTPPALPFEVLGIIFTYYVETETLFYSLETLQLVSRLWNLAALGHKALWGNLHIHLGHKPTHDAWRAILPRRIERAGATPLNIEIRFALEGVDHPYYDSTEMCAWEPEYHDEFDTCACAAYAAECAQDLLETLTGPKGEYCKRWKRLHITLGGHGRTAQSQSKLLCDPLSYPTPLLESIHLKRLKVLESGSRSIFPSIPSVHSVHFEECTFDSLDGANFSSAEIITFQGVDITNDSFNILNFSPPTSIKVIHIHEWCFPFSKISGPLPHLHTLHLGKYVADIFAPDFDLPSLKTLTIPMTSGGVTISFEDFTFATNRPLSTVKFLTLSQTRPFSLDRLTSLKLLLDELESIERIAGSKELLAFILKFILIMNTRREGRRIWSNLSGRTLELVHPVTGSVARLVFHETMGDVDIYAACKVFDLPDPMLPWIKYEESLRSFENGSVPWFFSHRMYTERFQ